MSLGPKELQREEVCAPGRAGELETVKALNKAQGSDEEKQPRTNEI